MISHWLLLVRELLKNKKTKHIFKYNKIFVSWTECGDISL